LEREAEEGEAPPEGSMAEDIAAIRLLLYFVVFDLFPVCIGVWLVFWFLLWFFRSFMRV
jgi:hypothetical protein